MWKPIETAPDDRFVLIRGGKPDYWDCDEDGTPPMVCAKKIRAEEWRFACYDGGYYGVWENPTEWMDVP